jgi:hypothetical protein
LRNLSVANTMPSDTADAPLQESAYTQRVQF